MDVPELVDAFRDQPANHALLIQRVQELMGQGIDVSSLFATLVSSASTREMTIKKAAYAFLAKYGRTNEELSLLSINTLHQDCTDPDPIVRSLALRTLCSLGQKSLLRFLLQPLNKGFQDKNAHVRKTAAMACISLFELDPVFVLESEIVDKLYSMLRDRDAPVVVNAILALETILTDEGGMVVNQKIASYLIQRYKDWSPSQLQIVLGVLCRYRPQTNDEIYEIMNDVDDGLQHPSLAVQMATLRLFIWLCQDLAEIQEDVQKTIEETLIKHLDSPSPDLVHASLCHLTLMVEATGKFQNNTTQHLSALFCRPSDPIPIKLQKLALCSTITQQQQQHASIATADTTIPSLSRMILDHFCLVTSMKDVVLFQQSTAARGARQQPLDRQTIAAQLEVACQAIDAIGQIGSHQFSQTRDNGKKDKSNPDQANIGNNVRACIDRLFQLLVLFGNMERVSSNIRNPRKESDTNSWMHSEIAALDLEESQVALVLSTILMAIERCWQGEFERRQNSISVTGGILDAFQVKVLGMLLLRHLDQSELDRLAQKKKPLRFRYDPPPEATATETTNLSASASSMSFAATDHLQQQGQPGGGISKLARISGIKILLLEESAHQLALRQQQQQLQLPQQQQSLTQENDDDNNNVLQEQENNKKMQAIRSALEMRAQYVLLLQQQIQDMVQSIDHYHSSLRQSDAVFSRRRAERLAVLDLACHLVAFSIEHQQDERDKLVGQANNDKADDEEKEVLVRRLGILAQAVDQLIPGPNTDLPPSNSAGSVSKDVADRARLVEAMFLVPLLTIASAGPGMPPSPRTVSQANPFDSPVFATEAYRRRVTRSLVAQSGVRGAEPGSEPGPGLAGTGATKTSQNQSQEASSEQDVALRSIDQLVLQDWLFQVGFNTLAVLQQ